MSYSRHPTQTLAQASLTGSWRYIAERSSLKAQTWRCMEPGRENTWAHIQRDAGGWTVNIVDLARPAKPFG